MTPPETAGAPAPAHPIDLAATLRALRRRADLSQRELAARAGVPASTLARIESGAAHDPRFRTVERLAVAVGGAVTAGPVQHPAARLPAVPQEELRDEAGRHYPAHLDVRTVTEARDWWGAWWANWYQLPRERWPRPAPEHTYDLDRRQRDERRRRHRSRAAAARLRIELLDREPPVPPNVWRWVARDPRGGIAGWVGGYLRSRRVDGQRELVIGDVRVAAGWQRLGVGSRLLAAVREALPRLGAARALVLIDEPFLPYDFFRLCGFVAVGPPPLWLAAPGRPVGARGSGQPAGGGGEGGERFPDPPG